MRLAQLAAISLSTEWNRTNRTPFGEGFNLGVYCGWINCFWTCIWALDCVILLFCILRESNAVADRVAHLAYSISADDVLLSDPVLQDLVRKDALRWRFLR